MLELSRQGQDVPIELRCIDPLFMALGLDMLALVSNYFQVISIALSADAAVVMFRSRFGYILKNNKVQYQGTLLVRVVLHASFVLLAHSLAFHFIVVLHEGGGTC